jgi:uncharacterized damage-inducible protein DinB
MPQATAATAATPALEPLLAEFRQECSTTRRLLERVPTDKLGWKPSDKSMTLGQLALHLSGIPGGFAKRLTEDVFEPPAGGFTQRQADSTAEVLEHFDKGVAALEAYVAGLTPETSQRVWSTIFKGKTVFALPRVAAVRVLVLNHSIHHRGQLSVYLRELGVPIPSTYGPSGDENPFA